MNFGFKNYKFREFKNRTIEHINGRKHKHNPYISQKKKTEEQKLHKKHMCITLLFML